MKIIIILDISEADRQVKRRTSTNKMWIRGGCKLLSNEATGYLSWTRAVDVQRLIR